MKQAIEIQFDETVDGFEARAFLLKIRGIAKVNIATLNAVRVYYSPLQMPAKKILKLVGTIGQKGHRKRLTNVVSVTEYTKL